MEYLLGFGCVFIVLLLSILGAKLAGLVRAKLPSPRLKAREHVVRKVCSCPGCSTDLYLEIRNRLAKRSGTSVITEVSVACEQCGCSSNWLPIADPPELRSFRHRGHRGHRDLTKMNDGRSA